MTKHLPLLVAAIFNTGTASILAQDAPAAPVVLTAQNSPQETRPSKAGSKTTPRPATTPSPDGDNVEAAATPKPRRPNFFQRLFGRKKRAAETPAPESTPAATPPGKTTKRSSAPRETKPSSTPKPDMPQVAPPTAVRKSTTPAPTASPKPAATPNSSPRAGVQDRPASAKAATAPSADADPDAAEKSRFEQAKAKAMEDSQIQALKTKADNATTEEESQKALRAYNKALFEKIRKIDGTVSERATRMEAAILRRLNE